MDLKEAIHDYWRLKVPLILAPSYGYTSADQPLIQEHFRNALIHPLEAFICGSGNTREVFEVSHMSKYFSKNTSNHIFFDEIFLNECWSSVKK